jgi:peptidoglycan glycosyltransferase
MAAIVNGGILYKPRLVSQIEDENGSLIKGFPGEIIRQVSFPPDRLNFLRECLVDVVYDGTAQPAEVPGINIAGKTGTAQVGTKAKARQVVWMNGFVPAERPQYVFAVMMEGEDSDDLHGGEHVGPLVGNIFSKIFAAPAKAEPIVPGKD